jgi:YbbR domain-containing protein
VEVALDVPTRKALPVQVDWVGSLSDGLILESVSVTPGRVTLVGAKAQLDRISTLYTEKVKLDPLDAPGSFTAGLVLQSGLGVDRDDPSNGRVTVRFTIARRDAKGDARSND